jgi:flavodoxin I
MSALVMYDSQYGNTRKIAEAIGQALASQGEGEVQVIPVSEASPGTVPPLDLLVVGSPTQALTATPAIKGWIKSLAPGSLKGIKAAAFDTRFTEQKISDLSSVLAFFVRIFGYAADPIASWLKKKGAEVILPPEGFYVGDTEGPLLENELERAAGWARKLTAV